jgi:hypothetical protein
MTDDIREVLHRAAEMLPDTPDRLQSVRRKRTAHVRRRVTAVVAVLLIVSGVTALGLTRGHGGSHVLLPVNGAQELTATGRVVQVPGKAPRFCAPAAVSGLVSPLPPPQWCALGVDVRGVDFATLQSRYAKDGAVQGEATLTGRIERDNDNDVLVVTDQEPPIAATESTGSTYHPYPGCSQPAGGWPQHPASYDPPVAAMDQYQARHVDQVAIISVARPDPRTAVPYVLTWGDPEQAKAAMRSSYGDEQCVLQSNWTQEQVTSAAHDLSASAAANQVYEYGSGHGLGQDGQLLIDAAAVRPTAGLSDLLARHPAGLIRIDYWLHPVN